MYIINLHNCKNDEHVYFSPPQKYLPSSSFFRFKLIDFSLIPSFNSVLNSSDRIIKRLKFIKDYAYYTMLKQLWPAKT